VTRVTHNRDLRHGSDPAFPRRSPFEVIDGGDQAREPLEATSELDSIHRA